MLLRRQKTDACDFLISSTVRVLCLSYSTAFSEPDWLGTCLFAFFNLTHVVVQVRSRALYLPMTVLFQLLRYIPVLCTISCSPLRLMEPLDCGQQAIPIAFASGLSLKGISCREGVDMNLIRDVGQRTKKAHTVRWQSICAASRSSALSITRAVVPWGFSGAAAACERPYCRGSTTAMSHTRSVSVSVACQAGDSRSIIIPGRSLNLRGPRLQSSTSTATSGDADSDWHHVPPFLLPCL
jgi:hypothetical protein